MAAPTDKPKVPPVTRLEYLRKKIADRNKNRGGARSGAGRHTKYRKEYCELLIEHMREGYSYNTFAAVVEVMPSTLYEWEKKQPEWVEAKERAQICGELGWETTGLACARGAAKGSYSHWAIMGKNIYGKNISFDGSSEAPKSDGFVFMEDQSGDE